MTNKDWNELKANDSWAIFKIMAEFVEGYDKMGSIGPCVSVFGSARTDVNNPYYLKAVETSKLLVEAGFGVITGGGPGIMEAGNKGAVEGKGVSVGLNIDLPFEQSSNQYVTHPVNFDYFFVRKVLLPFQVALELWMNYLKRLPLFKLRKLIVNQSFYSEVSTGTVWWIGLNQPC